MSATLPKTEKPLSASKNDLKMKSVLEFMNWN